MQEGVATEANSIDIPDSPAVSTANNDEAKILVKKNGKLYNYTADAGADGNFYVTESTLHEIFGNDVTISEAGTSYNLNETAKSESVMNNYISAHNKRTSTFVVGEIPGSEKNRAVQRVFVGDNILFRYNVIFGGANADKPYMISKLEHVDVGRWETMAVDSGYTCSQISMKGIETLSGYVDGLDGAYEGQTVFVSFEVREKQASASEIKYILAQKDNARQNYVVIFLCADRTELRDTYPQAYWSFDPAKGNVAGYVFPHSNTGSTSMVIFSTLGGRTAAHEAMHLLGMGDFGTEIDVITSPHEVLSYGVRSTIRFTNVNMYIMLKSFANGYAFYEWDTITPELNQFVRVNGLKLSESAGQQVTIR